jgi:DNA topoisomerase-1
VYKAIGQFKKGKKEGADLFDRLDTTKLNLHLKEMMPSLTAKVFRTYNASITLDRLLQDTDGETTIEMIADYQRANKEVAILCNHQRSVSKGHSAQMERQDNGAGGGD